MNFFGCKTKTHEIVQEEIVQFVRTNNVLGFLCNFTIFIKRQQFRTYRSIQNVGQNFFGLFVELMSCPAYEVAYQCFGYSAVHTVHGHVVAVVGRPAECRLR